MIVENMCACISLNLAKMSSSQSDSEYSLSGSSEIDVMSDFKLEVEEIDFSDWSSTDRSGSLNEAEAALAGLATLAPYDDEPIADEELVKVYKEKKETETVKINALQDQIDKVIPLEDWYVMWCHHCRH